MRTLRLVLLAALVLALAGCGGHKVHVWGEVSYDGKPVASGTIEFVPVDGTRGPSTGGMIVDGRYDVPAKVGPLPGGVYQVEIRAMRPTGETMPDPMNPNGPPIERKENYIPDVYNTRTTLKVTISSSSAENQHDFRLEKRALDSDKEG